VSVVLCLVVVGERERLPRAFQKHAPRERSVPYGCVGRRRRPEGCVLIACAVPVSAFPLGSYGWLGRTIEAHKRVLLEGFAVEPVHCLWVIAKCPRAECPERVLRGDSCDAEGKRGKAN
jgi:hypothetical protein